MAKLLAFLLVAVGLLLAVRAQLAPALVNPEDEATKIADIGAVIIQARLQKANLPDDLLVTGLEVALNAKTAYSGCKVTLNTNHVIWQYRLCVISNLKVANLAVSQLETEARDREAAAAAAATAALAAAEQAVAAPDGEAAAAPASEASADGPAEGA